MANRKKICVFGCDEFAAYLHRFPHPQKRAEQFALWMSTVGERLKNIDAMKIYTNKRICDYHFKPEDKMYGHRLSKLAVPVLHLEGVFKSKFTNIETEHNYCIPRMFGYKSGMENQLLASQQYTDLDCRTQVTPMEVDPICQPSTSRADHPAHVAPTEMGPMSQPSTSQIGSNRESCASVIKRHRAAQRKIRKLKNDLLREKTKLKSFQARLTEAESFYHPRLFHKITKDMTAASKIFTGMQLRQSRKKPKGRRFTLEEKIMSLSLFKKSQKAYNLLYKYFTLPSAKSLKNLLGEIKVTPGINKIIFDKLKDTVSDWSRQDRLCTVIFDEMSLNPQVHYDASKDVFKGFTTVDDALKIANHVLLFMIKGVKLSFKQPVAYYFTQCLNKIELKKIIKEVITNVLNAGLNVLCTVCDQSQVNVGAINSLISDTKGVYLKTGREWRNDFFEVKKRKIVPLYDVPHLLKGVRNNLLNKNMSFIDPKDNVEKSVKWEYFQLLYEADKPNNELTFLHKLTDEHIYPDKIKKMRVKLAAQVFSHSVAVTTDNLTRRGDLLEECRQIIPFVLLIDQLFDSFNSSTFHIPSGKKYRGPVRQGSPHHLLWQNAIKLLKSVKFTVKKTDAAKVRLIESTAPSITNFIKTIKGMQDLWDTMHSKYSLDCVLTRNFNQDPVENFFGNIRSLGVRNISPNCVAFEGAYKTLLLNNFNSPHSIKSNCEEDVNKCLQTLQFFVQEKQYIKNKESHSEDIGEKNNVIIEEEILFNINTNEDTELPNYVCGWVLSKCLKKIKKCGVCRENVMSDQNQKGNYYIQAKEYENNKKWLCYPSESLSLCFQEIQKITCSFLKNNLQKDNMKENIKMVIDMLVVFPFQCDLHKAVFQETFVNTTINILIYSWCRSINRILSGKIKYVGDDPIKKSAQIYFNKYKNKKY